MNNHGFKDKYYWDGKLLLEKEIYFVSNMGLPSGNGTRENPYSSYRSPIYGRPYIVLGAGYHQFIDLNNNNGVIGSGMDITFISGRGISQAIGIQDLTLMKDTSLNINYASGCKLFKGTYGTLKNCIVIKGIGAINPAYYNSFSGYRINSYELYASNSLFDRCEIYLNQLYLNEGSKRRHAFNNCTFKIGNESAYTPLQAETDESMRNEFISRYKAQGLNINESDIKNNWFFCKNSVIDGRKIIGTPFHQWCIRYGEVGCYGSFDSIAPRSSMNTPNSINTANPFNQTNTVISENSISFKPTIDISTAQESYATSNIIWMGGYSALSKAIVVNNFPPEYGVQVNSTRNIGKEVTTIEPGRIYLVRSKNNDGASINYNSTNYYSNLVHRGYNIFAGVSGKTSFTALSGQPQVFEINPSATTIKLRAVKDLPADIIKSGNLQTGYWYFVEPDSATDTSGTITYKGITYPTYSSFLVDATTNFSITGAVHLRRCWKDAYEESAETIDKAFWAVRQKPKWMNVIPDDLRCLMERNLDTDVEMKSDVDGDYITSGHNEFYPAIMGSGGILLPAFPIKGTFIQLRIDFSTLNLM